MVNYVQRRGGSDPMNAQAYRVERPEAPEDLVQPLYDRVNYAAAGASQLSFFSTARGQSTTLIRAGATGTFNKTYRDTNMDNTNVVPTKLHKIHGISLGFAHEDEGDAQNPIDRDKIRTGGVLHFRVVDKDILYLPLIAIPELNPYVFGVTTGSIGTVGGGGAPMLKFKIPITLNPYVNFNVTIDFDGTVTTTKAVDVYLFLHATMRRPT